MSHQPTDTQAIQSSSARSGPRVPLKKKTLKAVNSDLHSPFITADLPEEIPQISKDRKLKIEQDEDSLCTQITTVTPLKKSAIAKLWMVLMGIFTLGFSSLVMYWVPKWYIRLNYKKCSIDEADT
jgi:hypothetical protein